MRRQLDQARWPRVVEVKKATEKSLQGGIVPSYLRGTLISESVLRVTCLLAKCSLAELRDPSRRKRRARWRKAACAVMRKHCRLSWHKIGQRVNRDHSTALMGARRADPFAVEAIEKELGLA